MKKIAGAFAAVLLAALIVLPVISSVNPFASNSKATVADGWPLPPRPSGGPGVLTADGWPLPPRPSGVADPSVYV